MNRYRCKGYLDKSDHTPVIRWEIECKHKVIAQWYFEDHLRKLKIPVTRFTIRKLPERVKTA